MNKQEIMEVLSEKSFFDNCVYCKTQVKRGLYAEDNIGNTLVFPRSLTSPFVKGTKEMPIHYRCLKAFIFDLLREGEGGIGATKKNTKILIRH